MNIRLSVVKKISWEIMYDKLFNTVSFNIALKTYYTSIDTLLAVRLVMANLNSTVLFLGTDGANYLGLVN